jgi:hypothetical protein
LFPCQINRSSDQKYSGFRLARPHSVLDGSNDQKDERRDDERSTEASDLAWLFIEIGPVEMVGV